MGKLIKYLLIILFVSVTVYAGSQQTSSKTVQYYIDNSRYYLNESTEGYWTDAELLSYANAGLMDIATRTRCLEGSEDFTLVADTVEYPITSQYIDVSTVIYTNSDGAKKGLIRKNPQSVGNVDDPGEPVYWYEYGGNLGVFPSMSTVVSGSTVTAYLVTPASAAAASSSVSIPMIYDRALTLYITAQAFMKEGAFAKSGRLIAEYLAELERYRTDLIDKPQEPESNIKTVQ